MSLRWRDAAAVSRSGGSAYTRTADGTSPTDLKTTDQIRLRLVDGTDPAHLSEIFKQGIQLAVDPDSAFGVNSGTGPIYTNSVTVGVAGGTPPYTHAWTGTTGFSIVNPTSATTAFIGHSDNTGTATDTVRDANGVTNFITVPVETTRNR